VPSDAAHAAALVVSARAASRVGQYDQALADVRQARGIFEALADTAGLAEVDNIDGVVHLERAEYRAAADLFGAALVRYAAASDAAGVARAQSNLGLVHWRIGDIPRARADFEAALAFFQAAGDARGHGNTLNSLGLLADDEGDPRAAIALYARALELVVTTGDTAFTANIRANLADAHEARGVYDAAWQEACAALELRVGAGLDRGIVGSRISLARLALGRGDHERATAEIALGASLAGRLGLKKHTADLLDLSARLAAAKGEWEHAYTLAGELAKQREALRADEVARHISDLRARMDLQEAARLAEASARENEALRRAAVAAQDASRAKSEFVAVISHEIRAPLAATLGAIELLRESPLDAAQAQLLCTADASARALLGIVNDVLDIASIEAGRLEIEHAPYAPRRLIDQVVQVVHLRARAKDLGLEVHVAPGVPETGVGDVGRTRQVLLNLVSNAIKFTPAGSVRIAAERSTTGLRLSVADTGIGIAADVLPRLFRPFEQADSSTTRRFGGTGLGLSIAHRLVTAMGGTIGVTSQPGVGSTFQVDLPFPRTADARQPAAPAPRRTLPPGCRVLVVDDDPAVSEVIVAMLVHIGCDVVAANNAAAAEERAASGEFALVVLDVHMPDVDGFELARRLRARHGPSLPLFGLSGAATREAREEARAAGMDGYITKPVTLERLRELVESTLSAGGSASPSRQST